VAVRYHLRGRHPEFAGSGGGAASSEGPYPEVRRPKVGASKGVLQRCSFLCSISSAPALSFEVPSGRIGMRLPWVSALAARKIIGAPTKATEAEAIRCTPSTGLIL